MIPIPVSLREVYYFLKPCIPRSVQISLRRRLARRKKSACAGSWPIDDRADSLPPNWCGWPEGKKFALILTHDVDTERGQSRCLLLAELEKDLGLRSSFNFVPRRYDVLLGLRHALATQGFEVGVHGLYHDGKYFRSRRIFQERAIQINRFLRQWGAVGFRAPSMLHNLDWIRDLEISYDASTFDTDPFEPQPAGMGTIFPFWVPGFSAGEGYVELPYTLPQDFTLFVLLKEKTIDIWKRKLEWIAGKGGMALLNVHPDYMNFDGRSSLEEYPVHLYRDFLRHVKTNYADQYWHALPRAVAGFWKERFANGAEERKGASA